MKFCTECNNMYYIKVNGEDANTLVYYCRFCGHEDNEPAESGVVVLRTEYKKTEQQFSHMVNRYIKHDPTLPRIANVKCPNDSCTSNATTSNATTSNHGTATSNHGATTGDKNTGDKMPSVIYLRYDDDNMKYLYICEDCDTTWKTDDNK
jgi:DNA-directed RNA polymerase subunit M/transcription elongation factor TFIIS